MTLSELAKYFNYSESSLKANYKRTIKNLSKKGIFIIKTGYGDKANYQIVYKEIIDGQENR